MSENENSDELLAFTVSTVWRDQRVSCPHPNVLASYDAGSLPKGAMGFVRFHLEESNCPYCHATLADVRQAPEPGEEERQERLLRSTVTALRRG